MKRSLITILAIGTVIIMLCTFIVTGCKTTGTSGETSQVTTAAETTVSGETTAETTAATETKKVEYKIACYFPAAHEWFLKVEEGIAKFTEDTGIEVFVKYGQAWDQGQENQGIEALVAQGYNKIMLYPVDFTGANSLYEEVVKKGVDIINIGTVVATPTPSKFSIASDVKQMAMGSTEYLITKLLGGKGNIMQVGGVVEDTNSKLRVEGVNEVVAKYPDVKLLLQTTYQGAAEDATEKISNAIANLGDELDGIVATECVVAGNTVLIFRDMENTRIKFVGIDDEVVMLEAIKDGIVDVTNMQNPYLIGYMGALLLKLMDDGYTTKEDYVYIDSGSIFITKDNLDTYKNDLFKAIDDMAKIAPEKYFNPLAN